jgi:hypothetical protein
MSMAEPFVIELHLGGSKVIKYTLTEDEVRDRVTRGREMPALAVLRDESEPDERKRLRTAAYYLLRRSLDPAEVTADFPAGRTVSVVDDDGVWIVPLSSIQTVYLRDPSVAGDAKAFGFRMGDAG